MTNTMTTRSEFTVEALALPNSVMLCCRGWCLGEVGWGEMSMLWR